MTTDHWGYEKEQQPDIVEVIRCKYCDHWNKKTHGCDRNRLFEYWEEDDFCSFGVRREKWSNISKAE